MENLPGWIAELLSKTLLAVIQSFSHNWIPLSLAIITAAILKVHVNTEKLQQTLRRKTQVSILVSVIFGAFTPFCACGTMAVVIGMFTTTLPWGPIMAFLTSSPIMSPEGFIMIMGIIGLKFAIALTIASIIIGLGSGYLTNLIETRSDFLKNQTRFTDTPPAQTCACSAAPPVAETCGCGSAPTLESKGCCNSTPAQVKPGKTKPRTPGWWQKLKCPEIWKGVIDLGFKQIVPNFALFIAIGFLINYFVPTSIIMGLFSSKNRFAVPLAALIGLPLYVTTESSIPLIQSLMTRGASNGAMLGFMITGSATSAWVVAGISMFMRKKVIGLYLLYILAGGILCGYLYDFVLLIWK